jgi:LPXTG-motif cell wall-anchored protein
MKKTAFLTSFILLMLFASSVKAAVASPHLSLSPSNGNYSVDDTFTVTVNVDSASEVVGGVDGVGTYDSSKLELTSASKASGMVFESTDGGGSCSINTSTAGKFSFTCYSNDSLSDKAVSGSLVVLNFKAISTGTAAVSFTCTSGSTTDSNIVKTSTSGDVIVCGENVNGSYVIGESDGDSTETNTPTSSTLPKTGSVSTTLGLVAFGAVSLLSAVFLKFL